MICGVIILVDYRPLPEMKAHQSADTDAHRHAE
jgi:hypothetical protein